MTVVYKSGHALQNVQMNPLGPTRNRAGKDVVRWCHLTQQFIAAGAYVHSRETKTRAAEVYRYFVSKRFMNPSIIIKS